MESGLLSPTRDTSAKMEPTRARPDTRRFPDLIHLGQEGPVFTFHLLLAVT